MSASRLSRLIEWARARRPAREQAGETYNLARLSMNLDHLLHDVEKGGYGPRPGFERYIDPKDKPKQQALKNVADLLAQAKQMVDKEKRS